MATYIVNPLDPTTPTNQQGATQGAEELRGLKASVNARIGALTPPNINGANLVRQSILQGPLNTSGQAAQIAIGAGLNVDLKASVAAVIMAFAGGFGILGAIDTIEQFAADSASYWPNVQPNLTNYLNVTRTGPGVLASGQTLAPPQWNEIYNQAAQSVLQFAGVAGSVVFLDDFGNTWAPQNNARVQTNQFKFGTGGLGGGGGANVLNGTTDYVKSVNFTSLGQGSWSLRCWAYITSLAALNVLVDATNATNFGAQIAVTAAGKVTYTLSSTGTSNDIAASPVAGAATILTNAWHFYELTYDALSGTYRMYVDGIQDQSTASTKQICALTHIAVGGQTTNLTGTVGYIDKFEFLPYCQHPSGTAYVSPVAAPSVIAAGYSSDWFDCSQWLMKSVSAPSGVAGSNPTFTTSNKLYFGEADTSGVAVTAVRPYAYRGAAITQTLCTLNTSFSANHNIGVQPRSVRHVLLNVGNADNGYYNGIEVDCFTVFNATDSRGWASRVDKNTVTHAIGGTAINLITAAGGSAFTLTNANWRLKSYFSRDKG